MTRIGSKHLPVSEPIHRAALPPSAATPAWAVVAAQDVLTRSGPVAQVVRGVAAGAGASPLHVQLAGLAVDPKLQVLIAELNTPQGLAAAKTKLELLLTDAEAASGQVPPELTAKLLELLVGLTAAGQLEAVLKPLAEAAWAKGALPPATPGERAVMVQQLVKMIETQLGERGLLPGSTKTYVPWDELSRLHLEKVRKTSIPAQGPGAKSSFDAPAFVRELEALQGRRLTAGNAIELLDGPSAFAARDRMIDGAKKSIQLMTWAFYDDATGFGIAEKLIAAKGRGVDVKIMVDAEVAREPNHQKALVQLEQAGIPVIRVPGHHRKVMVVDGREAIAGGLNLGDVYSHRGAAAQDPKLRWRDTDLGLVGASVAQGSEVFAKLWNEQVAAQGLDVEQYGVAVAARASKRKPGTARAAIIDDAAGIDGDAVFLSILKAIEGATERIDIENAYFILTPALRDALEKALARGVTVRILSNSAESVDVPIISAPILESLAEMAGKGAQIFLKTGPTLHSKFLVADERFVSIGSYNLHPQSHRYKGETNVNVLDAALATDATKMFERDIAEARKVERPQDIAVPKSALATLVTRFFFDFL